MKKLSNSNSPEFKRGLTEEEINSPEFNPDDFAPAPDQGHTSNENESLENRQNALIFAFIAAFFALIIGLVGFFTHATVLGYGDHKAEKDALSLFVSCDRVEKYDVSEEGYDVYAVFYKQKMAGYCVLTTVEGFGGDIRLAVAFNSDNMISSIRILDHNESRGLGSKIAGEDFLSQFDGLLIGNTSAKYDLISGATTSSTAVGEAVKAILGLGLSTESIANELGYETITEEEIEEEVKKEEEDKNKDPDKDKKPSDTTGNDKPDVDEFQGGANVNQGDGDMNLDGEDETTVYETETKKPDDDETTEADTTKEEETTKAPETTEKPEETTAAETTGEPEETTAPPEETTAPEETTGADTTDAAVTDADTTVATVGDGDPAAAFDGE